MITTLEREEEDSLHFYNTFNIPRFQDIVHTFMSFHIEKSGIFIGLMALELEQKSITSPDFEVLTVLPPLLGGTIVCRLTLGGTTA